MSTRTYEDRKTTAAVCRSTPNGLNNLSTQIDNCTTAIEYDKSNALGNRILRLEDDMNRLKGMIGDSLSMGDAMFGTYGHSDISKQANDRNTELKEKRDKLLKEIDKKEAVIERSNRDFTDVKANIPETQPTKLLRFVEDYTLAILSIAYLFMTISIIYLYTITSDFKMTGFLKASVGSVFVTIFAFMLLYFFA